MSVAQLKGRARWVVVPATVAVVAGVLIGCSYGWAAISFPPGTLLPLLAIVAAVSVAFNFVGGSVEQARLRPLARLAKGELKPSPDNLAQAARAVIAAPDATFWLAFTLVAGGAVLTGAVWGVLEPVSLAMAVRVGAIGLVLAPLTAVTGSLAVLPRTRIVTAQLIALGLTEEHLERIVPVRFEARRRLVIAAAVSVLTPLFLLTDLLISRALDQLLEVARTGALHGLGGGDLAAGVVVTAVMLIVILACAWLSGTALAEPLGELTAKTRRVARGEYGHFSRTPAEFETRATALALAAMERHLVQAAQRLEEAASGISTETVSLRAGAIQHQEGADQQNSALAATTATTEELARSAKQIATNAHRVSDLAKETLQAARSGNQSAAAFTHAMQEVRGGNQAVADSVVKLNKRVQQVGKIVEFINGIADKSDLLALNAELEGNKAGDVGRGFTLVAAEMRRLAESVMASTREISRLIDDIRDATNAAVMATEAGVKATEAGSALAQKVSDGLSQIVEFANLTADAVQSISTATGQQQAGTDQLVSAMEDILKSTRATVDASRVMSGANDALAQLAGDLTTSVRRFKGAS